MAFVYYTILLLYVYICNLVKYVNKTLCNLPIHIYVHIRYNISINQRKATKTPGREITETGRGRHKKGDRTFIPTAIIPQAAGEVKTQGRESR